MERFREDQGALGVLDALGFTGALLLGRGGEASVYALDPGRVLRVQRPGASEQSVRGRARLLDELGRGAERLSFAIPLVFETDFICDRWISIERRLPGHPFELELAAATPGTRTELLRRYLDAVSELGELRVTRSFFGELHEGDAVHGRTWREYLEHRARRSLELGGSAFSHVSASELASPFAEPSGQAFVYLDAYPGNLLVENGRVSAIVDFGGGVLIGDPHFNALAAASYLSGDDRAIGEAWLAERGLAALRPFRRWLAAYWAFARDDEMLAAWCRAELTG